MRALLLLALALPVSLEPCSPLPPQQELSPFTAVRMRGAVPEVRYGETWYELVRLDGVEAERILGYCRSTYGGRWEKRFAEDLVAVMEGLGHPTGAHVTLELRELDGSRSLEIERAAMTAENRARVWTERNVREPAPEDAERAGLSPFTDVRLRGDVPEVRFEGRWWRLASLEGISAERLVAGTREQFGSLWEKRLAEDLPDVLAVFGLRVGPSVALELVDLESGRKKSVPRAALSAANRRMVVAARLARAGGIEPRRVRRAHARRPARAFAFLAEPDARTWPADEPRLPRSEAEEDLDELESLLDEAFSYRDLRAVDWQAALDAVRCGLADPVPRGALALRIAQLLALSGDGHSGLDEDLGRLAPGGSAPFLIGDLDPTLVAFQPDRAAFLDPERPRLLALDGLEVERWLEAAAALVVRGSPAAARFRALRLLRHPALLGGELGLPPGSEVVLTLARLDGTDPTERPLALQEEKPLYGTWPRGAHRRLEGDIGYLRLARMEAAPGFLDELDAAMEGFRDTRGLVIDVRGNGGGSRDALLRLFPYFLRPDDPPRVANVAAYRLGPGEDARRREGYLEDRWLWPLTSERFTPRERAAIERAAEGFTPSWTPPKDAFSAWHWLVLAREANPRAYSYERPVVVLQDGGCFSATDVFLAAFQGWRDVTLLGTPSGGGSGRARAYRLAHSGIGVRLSSMASFRTDGRAYDGLGIQPDVLVLPAAEDFLGRGDAQLDAALARLRGD